LVREPRAKAETAERSAGQQTCQAAGLARRDEAVLRDADRALYEANLMVEIGLVAKTGHAAE